MPGFPPSAPEIFKSIGALGFLWGTLQHLFRRRGYACVIMMRGEEEGKQEGSAPSSIDLFI